MRHVRGNFGKNNDYSHLRKKDLERLHHLVGDINTTDLFLR
ncbi:MAG: hypothetical protein KR126chlam1_01283 [Chlamydiae bacterium]|nr:hypothetical protein [Chlamydiota bacterium]